MSKKVDILVGGGVKERLYDLFHQYLSNRVITKPSSSFSYGNDFGWDDGDNDDYWRMIERLQNDDWDYWDDDCVVYPIFSNMDNKKGKKKKHKHTNKRKKSVLDYDDDELKCYDNYVKFIYFYDDYHNKSNYLMFSSLKGFCDFCDEMGYSLNDEAIANLIYSSECHCCIKPESFINDTLEVIVRNSYGEMYYDVCEVDEL